MKLIIDIPDYMYEVIKKNGSGAPKAFDDAIANGTPLPKNQEKIATQEVIKELKDIKEELEKFALSIMKNGVNEDISLNGYATAIAIIDKHISDIYKVCIKDQDREGEE
jgi:hypothetical protein